MPWSVDTPYVIQLFQFGSDEPAELFYKTRVKQNEAVEKYQATGQYSRIWCGLATSDDRNRWKELGEWPAN